MENTTVRSAAVAFAALPSHKRFASGYRDGVNGRDSRHAADEHYSRGYYLGELTWEEDFQAARANGAEVR